MFGWLRAPVPGWILSVGSGAVANVMPGNHLRMLLDQSSPSKRGGCGRDGSTVRRVESFLTSHTLPPLIFPKRLVPSVPAGLAGSQPCK
ncbi:hypothetical protein B0T19DRAFT_421497 [Cercophora scortea]|uniref:Uncharacterized protein n=1 Tax=Cercophora scortea TaxID=314031 RepID=A0AAE0ILT2_9PEZI|nr:hypothetical protein B0T19DRAFT_421497 [Cercophora scortea]